MKSPAPVRLPAKALRIAVMGLIGWVCASEALAEPLAALVYRTGGVGLHGTPGVLSVPKGLAGSNLVELIVAGAIPKNPMKPC